MAPVLWDREVGLSHLYGSPAEINRLVDGGVIRAATEADRALLSGQGRLRMGASYYGCGDYAAEHLIKAERWYVTEAPFTLEDVAVAERHLREQRAHAKRLDLLSRIDGQRCPHCGR